LQPSVLVRAIIKSPVRRDPDWPDAARFGSTALRPTGGWQSLSIGGEIDQ